MCILCVIQKWSRKVATMLPWLVIPLIGLWLLSQFLPPAFRFEITSPRLACLLVLLVTLFWYEILMPQLSAWRVRRNARLFERKRSEAIEMQKLRKTATRRCRNCSTAYRDQNPSGGRFMCSHCGRISKRPVLDLSVPPGLERLSNSGFFSNWICGQDWLENGSNWANTSLPGKSSYSTKNGNGNDRFISEKSYSFLVVFVCKILATIFLSIMWVLRKLFRVSLAEDDASTDDDIRDLAKKGENGVNCNESRSEKARRKAEEKKQARLEKEQLEEEERQQREEVARLVEERRKLRDEKAETEKDRSKGSNNNEKREAERKRQERKKEKDRGSSKSNSDVDELEKRTSKEIEKNKKGEIERRDHHQKCTNISASNNNRGSVGTRYLDRMKGNFFSSSRTITESGLFGKGTSANTSKTREHRSSVSLDHPQITVNKRDLIQPERAHGNSTAHADDRSLNRPVFFESQPYPAPKRSWQQLFTRSSTNTNVISRPNEKLQTEAQISSTQGFNNPITFGLNSLPNFALGNATNPIFPQESDNFEDPCYVPDPACLIGPVSESLDNFQLDLGFEKKHNMPAVSPIESPVSRLRVSDETRVNSFLFPSNPRTLEDDNGAVNEKEWQMWNSSPIYQDTWCLPADLNGINTKEVEGTNNQYQPFNGSVWAKKEKDAPVSVEGIGSTSSLIPPVGGLYSTPDVHSLWSY